jgi:hypothetical protein
MIMDLDQNLDLGPKTPTISSDPSSHTPLPIILRNQAAKHLAALTGQAHLTPRDGGKRISDLKVLTFQTFADVKVEGRHLVRVLHGSLNQHFETLAALNAAGAGKARRRESDALTDREIAAARLARAIGRGYDAIYHGARDPEKVLRSGKLIPFIDGVSFSRSPEVAAYFAHLMGREVDQWSPVVLVLDRSSLIQTYRLEPCRWDETREADEREEIVRGRTINFRRHLLGVVREADVSKILGPPKFKFFPRTWSSSKFRAFRRQSVKLGERFVREGRARVRDIIVREREQLSNARSPVAPATVPAPQAYRLPKVQPRSTRR